MTRILTAAVLIAVVLLGIFAGSWWMLLGVIAAISVLTYIEYSQILQLASATRVIGLTAGLGLLVVPVDQVLFPVLLLALLATALPLLSGDLRTGFSQSASMFLGAFYIFGAMKTAYLLGLRNPLWLLFALAINWIGDSGAYYVGKQFGKHKLAPRISPGKSWEGAIASVVFSTAFFLLVVPHFLPISMGVAAVLGILGNAAGQVGDLAESALKRAVGVKDSGKLLPGHGGMLDRIDGVLFTLPVIYSCVASLRL